MSTFLQLCQRVARESGTIDGTFPTAVTAQTGRLLKIVNWTNDAWRSIQNAHESWLWLRSDFSGTTVSGTREYLGSALGVASRFGEFIHTGDKNENRYWIYKTADGVAYQRRLQYRPYEDFWTLYMRGEQTNRAPSLFTITPAGKLSLHPIPDASYTIVGPYRKDVQELSADGDTPEMPARFHDIIADAALMLLNTHDEAPAMIQLAQLRQIAKWGALEQSQLTRMTWPRALA